MGMTFNDILLIKHLDLSISISVINDTTTYHMDIAQPYHIKSKVQDFCKTSVELYFQTKINLWLFSI